MKCASPCFFFWTEIHPGKLTAGTPKWFGSDEFSFSKGPFSRVRSKIPMTPSRHDNLLDYFETASPTFFFPSKMQF